MDIISRSNTRANTFKMILCLISCIVCISGLYVRCYAGDINGEEARVISVASGTFTYHGKVYKAYSDYVSELYGYLADDDVDLDHYQANNAIKYIYSNVKEGIDQGYVYEVRQPSEHNTDIDAEEKKSAEEKSMPNVSEAAQKASDKEVKEIFDRLDSNQKDKSRYTDKLSATETDASLTVSDEGLVIATKDFNIRLSKDRRIVPDVFSTGLIIVSSIILTLNVIILIILASNKCLRLSSKESRKPRKGHRRRRKIRKVCRNTITVTTSVGLSILMIILAVVIGLYDDEKIVQNIQSSGYFRYAYSEFVTGQGYSDKPLSYEEFIIQEKVAIESTMDMKGSIDSMDTSQYSIAPYIRRMQIDVEPGLMLSSILLLVAMVLAIFMNIFMDLRRDRGVRSIFISVFIGAAISFIAAIAIQLLHIENHLFIEPEYLYIFLSLHIVWLIKVLLVIGLFGAVIGVSMVGLYKSMRKGRG